jgi:Icc-related predicted phosphoesterase
MKVVLISDMHNREIDLPPGDLLVVGGDLTNTGSVDQLTRFNNYIAKHAHKYKHKPLAVAGNHDFLFEKDRAEAETILSSCQYIEDTEVIIDGVRIYGSPWTPMFHSWAFMKDRGEPIRRYWEMIPDGLDLLVTHGPPWGILDDAGSHVGCEELLQVVTQELRVPPRFHAFGHIHEGYGSYITEKTAFYNVSVCDRMYLATNAPTVLEI